MLSARTWAISGANTRQRKIVRFIGQNGGNIRGGNGSCKQSASSIAGIQHSYRSSLENSSRLPAQNVAKSMKKERNREDPGAHQKRGVLAIVFWRYILLS